MGASKRSGTDQKVKALVVDDDPAFCEVMKAVLEIKNYVSEVRTVTHGPDALRICESFHPDVVFIDSLMPVMDGDTLGSRLRSLLPSARMVSISAMAGKRAGGWADTHTLKTGTIFAEMEALVFGT